jgi:hypothetical protein
VEYVEPTIKRIKTSNKTSCPEAGDFYFECKWNIKICTKRLLPVTNLEERKKLKHFVLWDLGPIG